MTDRVNATPPVNIEPRVRLAFQSIVVPHALPNAPRDFFFEVANTEVFDITLTFTPARGAPLVLRRSTAFGDPDMRPGPRFDSMPHIGVAPLDMFVFNEVSSADLDRIFDAQDLNRLTVTATVQLQYNRFSLLMLEQMTRAAADTHTMANPPTAADAAAIEASFRYVRSGHHARVTFPAKDQVEIAGIPCLLDHWHVHAVWGPPLVEIHVNMSIRDRFPAADRDRVTRMFMAADHTRIHELSRAHPPVRSDPTRYNPPYAPDEERIRDMLFRNLVHYLWNYTDMQRAQRIFREVYDAGVAALGRPQLEAVRAVRDAIDRRMVTANHWADAREDWNTERYQHKLSDVFGGFHQLGGFASPVALLRALVDEAHLHGDPVLKAELALQYGVGHCGEHATVSYATLRALMHDHASARTLFVNVLLCGYANVDHAFVLGGFAAGVFYATTARNEGLQGETVFLIDLPATLAPLHVDGFVLDPYLAPVPGRPRTARELARFITHRRSRGRDLRTPYVMASRQYPVPPTPPRPLPAPPRNI